MKAVLSVLGLVVALGSASTTLAAPVPLTPLASLSCSYLTCGISVGARIKSAGRYLYTEAAGVGLNVYDVRTPSAPALLTTVASLRQGGDVIVSGRYIYLVSNGGVQIADAVNPAAPVLVGQVGFTSLSATMSGMSGKYIYAGLKIVDISDPTVPTVVGSLPVSGPGTPNGLALSGTNAYVTDDSGRVHILDVSDPTAASEVGYIDLGEPAYDIAISGTYAYVVTHGDYCDDEGCTKSPGHLTVLDISGSSFASVVSSVGRPKAPEGIFISGGYAYLSELSTNFYSYAGELTVVDIRSPTAPKDVAWAGTVTFAGSYSLGYSPQGVAVIGNAAYVTTPWNLYVYSAFKDSQPPQCQ